MFWVVMGERKYRFGYYIGNKMTGGCVAMEPKDSKEIYDLAKVGMLLRIVE
jgi:lipoprotein-anchoring transpeptidase ErfK/SrfK